jgi:hypothetical protein
MTLLRLGSFSQLGRPDVMPYVAELLAFISLQAGSTRLQRVEGGTTLSGRLPPGIASQIGQRKANSICPDGPPPPQLSIHVWARILKSAAIATLNASGDARGCRSSYAGATTSTRCSIGCW